MMREPCLGLRIATIALAGVAAWLTVLSPGIAAPAATPSPAQREAAPAAEAGAHVYASQCGACHTAYPPELLPARSWRAIIGNLTRHFGEDAGLSPGDSASVLHYTVAHAADSSFGSPQILAGLAPNATPLRITDMPVWRTIHQQVIASGQISLGTGANAAANCGRCHVAARTGESGAGETGKSPR